MKTDNIEIPEGGLPIHRIPKGRRATLIGGRPSGFTRTPIDVIPRLANGEQKTDNGDPM